jgi:uncharacterized membrane protein YphA (DoxX/SURF4 family)
VASSKELKRRERHCRLNTLSSISAIFNYHYEGEQVMNIALWIVQILLALAFALAGFMKVSQPIEKLGERMNWAKRMAPGVVRLVGSLEILGALGLILPKATGILPWLTPVAAVSLVLTMIGAIITHFRLQEPKAVGTPVVLLLLSLFIVLGYFVFVPVA